MTTPLTGKVTTIIDQYSVAINLGEAKGVSEGMKFDIIGPTIAIKDPENQEELGNVRFIKAHVQVTQVYEKFCVAESYAQVVERTLPFPTFSVKRTVTQKLPLGYLDVEIEEDDKNIKIGDLVEQADLLKTH